MGLGDQEDACPREKMAAMEIQRNELDAALRLLMKALDLYGGAASLTHPRLTRAMTAARKLIPENAEVKCGDAPA